MEVNNVRRKNGGGAVAALTAIAMLGWVSSPVAAAQQIEGQVHAGGGGVAGSRVSLWAATAGTPVKLAQTQTDADGDFALLGTQAPGETTSLYLVAEGGIPGAKKAGGDNPAIGLMAVLGANPPAKVVISEMTTVASVWTNAQFLKGAALQGSALGLRIAAGNVPSFVDLETGRLGPVIQDPLNSSQTPTLATFNTLGDLLTGCITRVQANACDELFAAATPQGGVTPTDCRTEHRAQSVEPSVETVRAA